MSMPRISSSLATDCSVYYFYYYYRRSFWSTGYRYIVTVQWQPPRIIHLMRHAMLCMLSGVLLEID